MRTYILQVKLPGHRPMVIHNIHAKDFREVKRAMKSRWPDVSTVHVLNSWETKDEPTD